MRFAVIGADHLHLFQMVDRLVAAGATAVAHAASGGLVGMYAGWRKESEERNADDAFAKNDYAGSRALYRLLERIYLAVPNGKTAARGVVALREIVKSLKTEAAVVPEAKIDSWLASSAREIAAEAESFASKGDLENACGAFTRAAFLLQKIRDTG